LRVLYLTDMSKFAGLFSGGVPLRAVANDGTSTSPLMSAPSALLFLLLWRMLSLGLWLFPLVVPFSGGNGSVIVMWGWYYKSNITIQRREMRLLDLSVMKRTCANGVNKVLETPLLCLQFAIGHAKMAEEPPIPIRRFKSPTPSYLAADLNVHFALRSRVACTDLIKHRPHSSAKRT
jgi:hypothetical protein